MSNTVPALESLLHDALPWCGASAIKALLPLFTAGSARKGETLLAEGAYWSQAFLIASGSVRLYFTTPDGREFNKNFFAEGVLVWPLTDAMWREPAAFGVAAMERTDFWCADITAIRSVLEAQGEWQTVQGKMMAIMLKHKLRREQDLLAMDGRERYEAFCRNHPKLAHRVPLAQLATYLGLTDVSLSRIRRKPAKD